MRPEQLKETLASLLSGNIQLDEAISAISGTNAYGQLDIDRQERTGQAEAIFGEGKTPAQVIGFAKSLIQNNQPVLCTRITEDDASVVQTHLPQLDYHPEARCLYWRPQSPWKSIEKAGIICAGTTDLPVAHEARLTLEMLGHQSEMFVDVGVAGIHRLFDKLSAIKEKSVLIVIAGMEGALPSVVSGLVASPVIATPTSVGYGTNLNGLTTMLSMLSSCSPGIGTVNINNGYGAAKLAARILEIK